jgi:hypothetical protein
MALFKGKESLSNHSKIVLNVGNMVLKWGVFLPPPPPNLIYKYQSRPKRLNFIKQNSQLSQMLVKGIAIFYDAPTSGCSVLCFMPHPSEKEILVLTG